MVERLRTYCVGMCHLSSGRVQWGHPQRVRLHATCDNRIDAPASGHQAACFVRVARLVVVVFFAVVARVAGFLAAALPFGDVAVALLLVARLGLVSAVAFFAALTGSGLGSASTSASLRMRGIAPSAGSFSM